MLKKNCNAYDFAHRQIFKTLTRDNLGGGEGFKVGGCAFAHFAHS